MAKNAVYNFLKTQNRPFSANDILENIGKEYGKAGVQRCLDDLSERERIFEKTYGKQKIYCVTQEKNDDPNKLSDSLRQLDQDIHGLTEKLKHVENELQEKAMDLQALQGKMTTVEAKSKRNEVREAVLQLQNKLKSFQDKSNPMTSEEQAKIVSEHEKYLREYKKRKRICMDILNSILENYQKTKQHLYEEIGLETDEDVEFTVESF